MQRTHARTRTAATRRPGFFTSPTCVCVLTPLAYRVRSFHAPYRSAFFLNSALHCHAAFTATLSGVLRYSLLGLGGTALFADLTTVGTLFALLRYCHWLQKGMKQVRAAGQLRQGRSAAVGSGAAA
jgi:hypothetical protein